MGNLGRGRAKRAPALMQAAARGKDIYARIHIRILFIPFCWCFASPRSLAAAVRETSPILNRIVSERRTQLRHIQKWTALEEYQIVDVIQTGFIPVFLTIKLYSHG